MVGAEGWVTVVAGVESAVTVVVDGSSEAIEVDVVVEAIEAGGEVTKLASTSGATRAVGVSATSLRTLPTAAAATVTATIVVTSHAVPIPMDLLMAPVWRRFTCTELTEG